MTPSLTAKLQAEGLLSAGSAEKIHTRQQQRLFSVHWELKTILYLGVLLLSTGLGILVYKNIDSIGHTAILIFIAAVSAGGYSYCFKKKLPFSTGKVASPNSFFDYVLLLSCLTFVTFIGYLQYQYHFFGDRFGLVTFIPMIVLFFTAYFFDHPGILSLAITNLAAWAGIAVTPTQILKENDFNSGTIIVTAFILGIALIAAGIVSRKRSIKAHFDFTYTNIGMHVLFIATLAAMFQFENIYLLCFLVLGSIAFYFYREALRTKSFYFLLILTLYTFIGLSYIVVRTFLFTLHGEMGGLYVSFLYFIGSGIGLILFLIRMNKKIKAL